MPGALDRLDLGDERVPRSDPPQQDLAAPEDHGQQVVEVVRHAPGEPRHGAEPLGLLELLEHALALGHVLGHSQDPGDRPVVVESGAVDTDNCTNMSSRRAPSWTPTVASPCRVRSHRPRQRRRGGVVGRRDAQRPVGHGVVGRVVPPQQRARRSVPPPRRAGQVELGDGQRRGLHHGLEPLLVALHGLVQPGIVERHGGHLGQQHQDRFVLGVERALPTEHDDGPVARPGRVDERDGHPRHGPDPRRGELRCQGRIGDVLGPTRVAQRSVGLGDRARTRSGPPTTTCRAAPWGRSPPPLPRSTALRLLRPPTTASSTEAHRGGARGRRPARRRGQRRPCSDSTRSTCGSASGALTARAASMRRRSCAAWRVAACSAWRLSPHNRTRSTAMATRSASPPGGLEVRSAVAAAPDAGHEARARRTTSPRRCTGTTNIDSIPESVSISL